METDKTRNDTKGEDDLLRLHRAFVSGCEAAREQLASLLVFDLFQSLSRKYAGDTVDRDVIWDGVITALLRYFDNPDSFDPNSGIPLSAYLRRLADWSIRKTWRSEGRRRVREQRVAEGHDWTLVEPFDWIECAESEATLRRRAAEILQSPGDRAVFDLWLHGERRTEAFAKPLGLSGRPVEVQRQRVKRAKDRILKTLRRKLGSRRSQRVARMETRPSGNAQSLSTRNGDGA